MTLAEIKAISHFARDAVAIVKCDGKERFWIVPDDSPVSPIEDAIGRFFTAHKRYSLGHQQFTSGSECTEAAESYAGEDGKLVPVYMLDHSIISFSINSFRDPWDSGQIGYWAFNASDLREIGDRAPEDYVSAVLKQYEYYVNGWIYGIFDPEDGVFLACDLYPDEIENAEIIVERIRDYDPDCGTVEVEMLD